ncbi:hypothetical protein LEP1GSC061_0466 [Leptospira wolffii serovar Khorat str. Khorat-H2]|nr:hypothetical protein LEP1GSC061_0466 [Leptospira wolffii serovar Khorat str. Khorat-H2]
MSQPPWLAHLIALMNTVAQSVSNETSKKMRNLPILEERKE